MANKLHFVLENSTYLTSKFYFLKLFQHYFFNTSVQANLQEGDRELHSTFVGSGKDKLDLVHDLGIADMTATFVKYLVANISTAVPLPGKFLLSRDFKISAYT